MVAGPCIVVALATLFVASPASARPIPSHNEPARPKPGAPHLQLRPVVTGVPLDTSPPTKSDPSAEAAIATCTPAALLPFGAAVPTTPLAALSRDACAVLAGSDHAGTRYLVGPLALDATAVQRSRAEFVSGQGWTIRLDLTPRGARAFDALAKQSFHQEIAMVVDGIVVSAPLIQPGSATFSSFEGTAVISGDFTSKQAKGLAKSINRWRRTG